jgi:hypothetical protein
MEIKGISLFFATGGLPVFEANDPAEIRSLARRK